MATLAESSSCGNMLLDVIRGEPIFSFRWDFREDREETLRWEASRGDCCIIVMLASWLFGAMFVLISLLLLLFCVSFQD